MPLKTTIAEFSGTCVENEVARYREECIFASCMSAVDIIAALGTSASTDRDGANVTDPIWMRWIRRFFSRQTRRRSVALKVVTKKPRKWSGYDQESRLERPATLRTGHEAHQETDSVICRKCSHVLLDRAA